MIGVVVPAHNEAALLGRCLDSLAVAVRYSGLRGEAVRIVVVLDACTDLTAVVAQRHRVMTVTLNANNVGRARAAGAFCLLRRGARWLSFTDADSTVSPDWLSTQLALGADAVCGVVAVNDWPPHSEPVRQRFEQRYTDANGHCHIHGANFGVSAKAYCHAGGFLSLPLHEDVYLVRALERTGARIAWSAAPRVTTSARLDCRAHGGFGGTLRKLSADAIADLAGKLPHPTPWLHPAHSTPHHMPYLESERD
jgi:glycosyltransferase involved in cell wall biosynthesis